MKTKQKIKLELRDGKSVLHTWTQEFETPPTVGDVLKVDTGANPDLAGYKEEAEVLLVEESGSDETVVLEAVPKVDPAKRPLVVMNKEYVPEKKRSETESFLRKRFEVPAFDWISSDLPQPIIDVHVDPKPPLEELRKITDELRDFLLKDAPVSVVK